MRNIRVLVCGGRDFGRLETERLHMHKVLDDLDHEYRFVRLIHGDAHGADRMAAKWADLRGIETNDYPADWQSYGKRAGYMRNQKMLDRGKPDLVIAFRGGKGTAMMIDLARKAGVKVIET